MPVLWLFKLSLLCVSEVWCTVIQTFLCQNYRAFQPVCEFFCFFFYLKAHYSFSLQLLQEETFQMCILKSAFRKPGPKSADKLQGLIERKACLQLSVSFCFWVTDSVLICCARWAWKGKTGSPSESPHKIND